MALILDLIMLGMYGKPPLKELLKVDAQAKVIIASSYADIGPVEDTLAAGAKG